MTRNLYAWLIRLHPPWFSNRFGDEMLSAFDEAAGADTAHLLLDALISVMRQWTLRSATPVHVAETADVPGFYTADTGLPSRTALLYGTILSVFVFAVLSLAIRHGGTPRLALASALLPSGGAPALPAPDGASTGAAQRHNAELQPPASRREVAMDHHISEYFHVLPVLDVLDADDDFVLSAEEIARTPVALLRLDSNRDGRLTAFECGHGLGHGGQAGLDAGSVRRTGLAFIRFHPVHRALDVDGDGVISNEEVQRAPHALRALDSDRDARLTATEVMPDAVADQVALIMRLDRNGDKRITRDERSGSRFTDILAAADRNRDTIVTQEELTTEVGRRADLNRDGAVTRAELLRARALGVFGP